MANYRVDAVIRRWPEVCSGRRTMRLALALLLLPLACVSVSDEVDGVDDETESEEAAATARPREATHEALAILALVNDRAQTAATIRAGTSLSTRVTTGIVEGRPYKTIAALDAVPFVGPATLQRLLAMATREGHLADQRAKKLDVIFSPQTLEASHVARVAKTLGEARSSIDVAMYSLSDAGAIKALGDAASRGVKVRVVYDGASDDRKLTGDALASSTSGRLEKMGIEVRWVNKIMHHKLAIVDGPRESLAEAKSARVISGSGNWSGGAATRYDENTLFFSGYPEVTLRLQREFDTLWAHSRPIGASDAVTPRATPITDADLPDDPTTHATFTSNNFTPKGDTFFTNSGDTVSTMLVAAIRDAKKSIHVAAGHLRSRPVAEALAEKRRNAPAVEIQVLLDGQEYLSRASHDVQLDELETCLAGATTEAKRRDCTDRGFLFGLQVADAGVSVRYKYYAYRWNVSYAKQMHHKYMVIDGAKLLTGSYNLSDNAEHDTFENVLELDGPEFAALVASYEANFKKLWELGRDEGRLDALQSVVKTGATIPLVFEPLTLDWAEVTSLKALIRANCPEADSEPFRTAPAAHQLCER